MFSLKNSKNSQEKACAGASFKKSYIPEACNVIKKRLQHRCFLRILQKILRTCFVEHLQTDASGTFLFKHTDVKKQKHKIE